MTSITRRPSAAGLALWQVDLDAPLAHGAAAMLSAEERARANRFVLDRNRQHFIAAHSALRQILASHTRGHPGNLLFSTGSFGKPALVYPEGVHFNLSHSQATALIAVGTLFPLGVDIELIRPLRDALTLAEDHFTQAECDALKARSGESRDQAFLTCWTRKEACLKALGVGLQMPAHTFEVGVIPDVRTVELPTPDGIAHVALTPVDTAIGSIGSLAQWLDSSPSRRRVERHKEFFA
jgi:4'-phosphopantetheinyl transferase